eukprot:PhM_4_TR3452/c1_g1_i1/m.62874
MKYSYLHRNHVLHGDIKGANILVGVDGIVKLADFGSATVSVERVSKARNTGTPLWMAPEVLRGEYLIGWASDIWALGCTVMEMLTGQSPWSHLGEGVAILAQVADDHRPLPLPEADMSPLALRFLRDCLVREPSSRWTAEQLLTHPFFGNRTITGLQGGAGSVGDALEDSNMTTDMDKESSTCNKKNSARLESSGISTMLYAHHLSPSIQPFSVPDRRSFRTIYGHNNNNNEKPAKNTFC